MTALVVGTTEPCNGADEAIAEAKLIASTR